METIEKQPGEKLAVSFDFGAGANPRIDVAETVSSINTMTATAAGAVTGAAALTLTGQASTGRVAQVFVDGGTSGESYKMRCRVTDSTGQVHELDGLIEVRER